jgi:hypothetical protein
MTARYMMFAALLTAPLSALICSRYWLFFFAVFPLAALFSSGIRYIRSLLLLSIPPGVVLIWAHLTGNADTAQRSLRWICTIASGTYFAVELGTGGIADVVRSVGSSSFARRFSDLMLMAGNTASNAREYWVRHSDLPLHRRILKTASDSVEKALPVESEIKQSGIVPVSVAVLSWLFLVVSISGITFR